MISGAVSFNPLFYAPSNNMSLWNVGNTDNKDLLDWIAG